MEFSQVQVVFLGSNKGMFSQKHCNINEMKRGSVSHVQYASHVQCVDPKPVLGSKSTSHPG